MIKQNLNSSEEVDRQAHMGGSVSMCKGETLHLGGQGKSDEGRGDRTTGHSECESVKPEHLIAKLEFAINLENQNQKRGWW